MLERVFTAVALLALCVPASVLAQQKGDVSKCSDGFKRYQDLYNKGDAKGAAALFQPDGAYVTPFGAMVGPAEIERIETAEMTTMGLKNIVIDVTSCGVMGLARWEYGNWKSDSPQGPVGGLWSDVETVDTGRIVNLTFNITPPPSGK